MSKIAMITVALVGCGFNTEMAVIEAERLAPKLDNKGDKRRTLAGGDGQFLATSLKERIVAYAQKRKGNVWSLSALALALKVGKNALSAQISHLIKSRVLVRTGRAEYLLAT